MHLFNLTGPASWGPGSDVNADSWTGSPFIVSEGRRFLVPANYQSGSLITTGETFDNTTLSAMGLTLGSYIYTFGSGPDADSIVVNISSVAAVPEASTWAMVMLGFLGLGFLAYRGRSLPRFGHAKLSEVETAMVAIQQILQSETS